MALDQSLVDAFGATYLRGITRQADLSDQAARDMSSVLMFDQRSLSAAVAREVAMAPNTSEFANLNTAARVPTTLDHYSLGAGPAAPGAPAGAGAPAAGK